MSGRPASAARPHRVVTSDGTALHAEVGGTPDAPVTVVLVHGWTQDHRTWDRVVDELPSGVRRVRYDLRGHGASDPARPGTATIDRLGDDLADVLAELAPDGRLVLVGHSMGGMTLMALAERHPTIVDERVDGVALVATSCSDMGRVTLGLPGGLGRRAAVTERRLATALESYRRDRLPLRAPAARVGARWLVFGDRPRRVDVGSVADQLLRAHPASVGAFQSAISRHDRRRVLARLNGIPGVVLAGTADRLCPPRHARVIAGEWHSGRLVTYPGAGHMLPQERAHEVALHISALLPHLATAGTRPSPVAA